MDSNYSLSDIAAVTDGGFGGGNNGLLWLFAILLLGGGGFGVNRGGVVTEADLCNANSFTDLKNGVRNLSDQIGAMNVGFTKGLCDMGYTMFGNFNNLEKQVAECCCQTQLGIQGVKFDMANYASAINANTTAQTQRILDKMCEDKEAAMAQRIQQLELQQAMCGVIRYPTSAAYFGGFYPFANNNCGCTNI